jgi:hypothetical protein
VPSSEPSNAPSSAPSSAPSKFIYNVAVCKPTLQSSLYYQVDISYKAVDDNVNGVWVDGSVTHTAHDRSNPWWKVDLEKVYKVERIEVYNRSDGCCMDRILGFVVEVYQGDTSESNRVYTSSALSITNTVEYVYNFDLSTMNVSGDIVRITITGQNKILSLAEVRVYSNEVDANPRVPPLCSEPSSVPSSAPSSEPSSKPSSRPF